MGWYWCMAKRKQYKKRPENKPFDAFISYSEHDAHWTKENLLERLETDGFKIRYHERDFKPGYPVLGNIFYCIENSHKVLFVLSQFCKQLVVSVWTVFCWTPGPEWKSGFPHYDRAGRPPTQQRATEVQQTQKTTEKKNLLKMEPWRTQTENFLASASSCPKNNKWTICCESRKWIHSRYVWDGMRYKNL